MIQFGDDRGDFVVVEQVEKLFPRRFVDLFEDLSGDRGFHHLEDQTPPIVVDQLDDFRDVAGSLIGQEASQGWFIARLEQRFHLLQQLSLFVHHLARTPFPVADPVERCCTVLKSRKTSPTGRSP